MRRVDWPFIVQEGPQVIKRSVAGLQKMQESLRDLHLVAGNAETPGSILEGDAMPSDLNEVVDQAILAARTQARDAFKVDRQFLLDHPIRVNPLRIQQAVTNVLNNAFEALSPGGVVRIVTRPRGTRVEIEITDTGVGMDASTLTRATEPFFTTKPAPAAGLGLSVANSIVRLHKGTLSLTSQPGRGSTVIVDLPLTN
jgi:signal transduction histidine kinase